MIYDMKNLQNIQKKKNQHFNGVAQESEVRGAAVKKTK